MQTETSSIAGKIIAIEDARHEENKRLNSEREILLALAPGKWQELKKMLATECANISARSGRLQFDCDEPDAQTFHVSRMVGNIDVRVLEFQFDSRIPLVVWRLHWIKELDGSLGFAVAGSNVLFTKSSSGVILGEFLTGLMMRITR
jgi:hypothetical protein